MSRRYVFNSGWRLAGAPDEIYAALRFNHDLMMPNGERGLHRYLERG
jgi:hypothetical protein